jgi:transglutaminase-like putative cysteine protease
VEGYRDSFGNWCSRLVAPAGEFSLGTDAIVRDPGASDPVDLNALQHQVQHWPTETLQFLLGSRYCETDCLSDDAWRLFGHTPLGWSRVQTICDFVHNHMTFGYEHSRATRTAFEAYTERRGVCRDFAHLAVTFCRCLNIPALLHRLHHGHRPSSPVCADGFCRMDRGLSRRTLAYLRSSEQCPSDRTRSHCAWP